MNGERDKRPASVTIVAALALAYSLYSLTYGVLALTSGENDRIADGVLHVIVGAGVLGATAGAFLLRRWGWTAFMVWAVIGLTHQVLRYVFFDDANFLDMAINTFAVLALTPPDVQIAFGLRHTENVQLARPSRNPIDSH